ncbi:MAG: efflux RND transporter permease subunit [Methylomonas sp.]|jgi:predicted RND superfamily exporter protein|uniref:efflux RND transporter permease subunit n=1 Tax=Methylomonas sp. TaxID=418 RepID=UPI002600EEB9|nr:efflux RND transporter permease subunit [Methylomonas sp.]MCK9606406.1 efflux RND transporter permease subunit [Methylomonas sp.]
MITAGNNRMRPIAMTTVAAILALLPLAMGIGAGSEMLQPLAIAIVSGLIVQTPLVLIVLPSFLVLLNQLKPKKSNEYRLTSTIKRSKSCFIRYADDLHGHGFIVRFKHKSRSRNHNGQARI